MRWRGITSTPRPAPLPSFEYFPSRRHAGVGGKADGKEVQLDAVNDLFIRKTLKALAV